jgi:signal transduction histidine kinase
LYLIDFFLINTHAKEGDGLKYSGPYILLIAMLPWAITQNLRWKSNKMSYIQLPSSSLEKIIALFLFASISIIFILTLSITIRFPETWTNNNPFLVIIFIMMFYWHMMFFSSIFALFRINLKIEYGKTYSLSNIVSQLSLFILFVIVILVERYTNSLNAGNPIVPLPRLIEQNLQIVKFVIETTVIVGCWHLIYRRLANTQIK